MKIFVAQRNPTIGDLEGNTRKVLDALQRAKAQKADIVLFSELTLSGYFPDDLLLDPTFIDAIAQKLEIIRPATQGLFVALGLPRWNPTRKEKPLYNSAALFADGKLLGYQDKILLPTYDVFDERRFFEPGAQAPLFEYHGKRIAITICEDAWQHADAVGYTYYSRDPIAELIAKKPDLLLNLSASPYSFKRTDKRLSVFQKVARSLHCPVVLCNQVGANDQLIFDGHSLSLNAKGELLHVAKGFAEDDLLIDLEAHTPPCSPPSDGIHDLHAALVLGICDYFHKQGFSKALLGLSGGIDSALVACLAVEALGPQNLLALTMPSRFSSPGSIDDSATLARHLGIELKTLPIDPLFKDSLSLLEPHFQNRPHDETEENLQSRIRGMILMAFSNKFGGLLLNTGNKSEMAMGYCTLYGDMAGGLGVLHDLTKLQIYRLAKTIPAIPPAILHKVPSAELRPDQKDTDFLPPFEILDPILEDYLEEHLPPEAIAQKRHQPLTLVRTIIARIHSAEYKRRQAPIGLRVTPKAFSKGRIVPIVQKWV